MENGQVSPKHLVVFGAVILALGIVAGPAVLGILSHRDDAATRAARRAADGGGGNGGGFDPQLVQARAAERLELMTTELHLSADQKAKVKAIQDGTMPTRITIMQNPSLSRDQMREQMRPIRAAADRRIQQVLAPAQQARYADFQAQMRARFGASGGGYAGGGYPAGR